MLDDFALWLGCNPSMQDPILCAVNTVLILPGLIGVMSVFLIYLLAVPILIYKGIAALIRGVISSLKL